MNNIYIDTNIIVNYYCLKLSLQKNINNNRQTEINKNIQAVNFLLKRNYKLYVSSLSVAQFVAILQNHKVPKNIVLDTVKEIITKFNIVDFTNNDIKNVIYKNNLLNDLEDDIQVELSNKVGCEFLITNNKKDFVLSNITVLKPKEIYLYLN